MLRATLRSLLAHKLRLLLTAVSVVLGVAFVAGSLVFTDTLKQTFNDLFTQTTPDVVITPRTAFTSDDGSGSGATISAATLGAVKDVSGVARAEGGVFENGVQIVGKDGKIIGTQGAPAFGSNWSGDRDLSPFRLIEGRGPEKSGEVAIDSQSADKAGLAVGGTVKLTTPGATLTDTVVGIFRYGTSGNLAGASIVTFDLRTAQQVLLGGADAYTSIDVKADPGISQSELAGRVTAAGQVQAGKLKVQTGKDAADQQAKQITDGLQFFSAFLLIFAGIALVVGSFIILNTFSMLVAQRTRELALLRALGASRRQVTRSVLGEALVVGLLGATVGLGVGVLLSVGLRGLFSLIGIDLPGGALVVRGSTVLAAYAVGVVVTLIAAYLPARRASRISPVAALRADASTPARSLRLRLVAGLVVLGIGLLGVVAGLNARDNQAGLVGLGGLLTFVGVIVLSPSISRRLIGFLGLPIRASGATGRIAIDNARRNPRRTASTASALMIGLALVSAIGVLGSSTTASTDAVIDSVVKADFIATNASFLPLSPDVAKALAATPGVGAVSRVQSLPAQVDGSDTALSVVDPATITGMLSITMVSGSLGSLGQDGLLVDDQTATAKHWKPGNKVPVTFLSGPRTLTVSGVYRSSGAFSGGVVADSTARAVGARDVDQSIYVRTAQGSDAAKVRTAVDNTLKEYPNVKLLDQSEFKQQIRDQVNQLLYLVYALLGLAVIIAILGIVNTLALSVVERTREIGLLRALGMTRAQLRQTVRLESVAISVYGALLGVVLGVGFGVALQRSLADQGIQTLGIPWVLLVTVLVLAAVVGVFAALWPARRAARLDVLRAITTE
jgi:putative ABC transport system permease protein